MVRNGDPVNRDPKGRHHSSVTFLFDIDCTKRHASDIALAAREHRFRSAFAKSTDRTKFESSEDIVMNTDKVIELGKVSEETQGVGFSSESIERPFNAELG
jgi:hypothetical protein